MNIKSILLTSVLALATLGMSACDESRGNDFKGEPGKDGKDGSDACDVLIELGEVDNRNECAAFFAGEKGDQGDDVCTTLINNPGNGINNRAECEAFLAGKPPTQQEFCEALVGPSYLVANDRDGDCVVDTDDNCPFTKNFNQKQTQNGRIGDACLGDFDNDGIPDDSDACPLVPGTTCANNFDGDTKTDAPPPDGDNDNCPFHINPDQTPSNPAQGRLDGRDEPRGAACVNDWDGDGITDDVDNCPTKFNPSQRPEDSCVVTPPEGGSSGLIDIVESIVSNLSDETAIEPLRELVAALASADPDDPGALAALTGPLNDLSNTETGPLGPLSELVQGLVATDEEGLEPLIAGLNAIIGGFTNDPANTPQEIAGLLLGLPDILTGLAGLFGSLAPPELPFP